MLSKLGEWLSTAILFIFGSSNQRILDAMVPIVERIADLEAANERLPDEAFPAKTAELKKRLEAGEGRDDLLPEAFAAVREAAKRTLGLRPFDVQMLGGIVLHRAGISEMVTGEGKTLVAVAPAYLNALTGKGVHIVTVNDYLARRDRDWMGPVYEFLGMRAGVIQSEMLSHERKPQYQADITYGTNNEFGFDYLRDNMKVSKLDQCQRGLHYAIIDEADSILIDEARTPLIISGSSEEATQKYYVARDVAAKLRGVEEQDLEARARAQGLKKEDIEHDWDYWYSEKHHHVVLTEPGIERAEKLVGVDSFFTGANMDWPHHLEQALKALKLYKRDVEYVVKEGEVIIVDQFTGRLMPGRTWSDGLHQAIEAKEALQIKRETQTLATITIQNYFRLYDKIAGMTGTAMTEAAEFAKIYDVDVVSIPTNRPLRRTEFADVVYRTEREKFKAIADEIATLHRMGRPQLVGTISIENSEKLSEMLSRRGIEHSVLNAKHHEREAHIVAQAGLMGKVTIATNMAGRGTDIILGVFSREELLEHWKRTGVAPKDARIDQPDLLDRLEKHWEAEGLLDAWEYSGVLQEWADGDGRTHRGIPLCEGVAPLGGLHIVGTERHEARRIDNQLRGRCGRQGDPGSSRFFLSLEDDLMRIFAPERVSWILQKLGMKEGEEISHPWVTKSIARAQKKVEEHNFDIRKRLLEYDEVMDEQRKLIYASRQEVLDGGDTRGMVRDWLEDAVNGAIERYANEAASGSERDLNGLVIWANKKAGLSIAPDEVQRLDGSEALAALLHRRFEEAYQGREQEITPEEMRRIERFILLQKIDEKWKDHLHAMDQLRSAIGLRGYAQVDPKDAYKKEGYEMFEEMVTNLKDEVTDLLFRVRVRREDEQRLGRLWTPTAFQKTDATGAGFGGGPRPAAAGGEGGAGEMHAKAMGPTDGAPVKTIRRTEAKVGRNDPCPCGSGKKFKKCCGAGAE